MLPTLLRKMREMPADRDLHDGGNLRPALGAVGRAGFSGKPTPAGAPAGDTANLDPESFRSKFAPIPARPSAWSSP
jgi:hypothetical protein